MIPAGLACTAVSAPPWHASTLARLPPVIKHPYLLLCEAQLGRGGAGWSGPAGIGQVGARPAPVSEAGRAALMHGGAVHQDAYLTSPESHHDDTLSDGPQPLQGHPQGRKTNTSRTRQPAPAPRLSTPACPPLPAGQHRQPRTPPRRARGPLPARFSRHEDTSGPLSAQLWLALRQPARLCTPKKGGRGRSRWAAVGG